MNDVWTQPSSVYCFTEIIIIIIIIIEIVHEVHIKLVVKRYFWMNAKSTLQSAMKSYTVNS